MEGYDSDLDDEVAATLPRLSFEQTLATHRNNRMNQTFGQRVFPQRTRDDSDSDNLTLLPSSSKSRVQTYENSCHLLETTVDWQMHALLSCDDITLVNRSFSFNDMRAFATAIESNLQSLTLSDVGLTTRSISVLCQALKKCHSLALLDLSSNKISKEAFEVLVERINELSALNSLSLADCGIRDSFGRSIGDLCRHSALTQINLSGNEFEEMSCIFIGNAMTENDVLTCLNISWNLIRSFAAIALFRGFEVNKFITEVDISWSNLGYDGSVALRRVLAVNKVLQRLNISNCNIDWTSAKLIGEGLHKNFTLVQLTLSFNPLTTHGVHHVVRALDNAKSILSRLDFSGIAVYTDTVRIAEKIAANRQFFMTYDFETPVHDVIGRQAVTKADSVRKVIQHIDERRWRPMDYFQLLNNRRRVLAQNEAASLVFSKQKAVRSQEHLSAQLVQPLTLKNLNEIINRQRLRDRLQKARQEQQAKDLKKRNQKILQTVNQHFPDFDVVSEREKRRVALERLARPRIITEKRIN